jgi:chemotaxis protein MotB
MANAGEQPIIIKKKKAAAHAHHGGAWKVAYADFVTAMMAFFLLLWLLGSTTKEEQKAVSGYFKDPTGSIVGQGGGLDMPGVGQTGPGGANQGVIEWNNPLSQPEAAKDPLAEEKLEEASDAAVAEEQAKREQRSLDSLQQQLEKEIARDDSKFVKLRDQILIDQTALGLRVQIVDKANRPMFASGSKQLEVYAEEVMYALAPILNSVANKLSVNGHTDAVPYGSLDYTNWELSADRANSARRALLEGDYPDEKILTVQGMGASVPRLPEAPDDASNRRIVILVLKKEVEEALKGSSLVSRTQEEFMRDAVVEPAPGEADPAPPPEG